MTRTSGERQHEERQHDDAPHDDQHGVLFDEEGLLGGRCPACDRTHFPLSASCPWCTAPDPAPHRLGLEGTVWAATVVATAPPGYEGPVPYGFGVVELPDDDLRVITRVGLGPDGAAPAPGTEVRFAVARFPDGRRAWSFQSFEEAS